MREYLLQGGFYSGLVESETDLGPVRGTRQRRTAGRTQVKRHWTRLVHLLTRPAWIAEAGTRVNRRRHGQTFVRGWTGHLGNAAVVFLDERLWDEEANGPKPFPRTLRLLTGLYSLHPPKPRTYTRFGNEFYEISDWADDEVRGKSCRAARDPPRSPPAKRTAGPTASPARPPSCAATGTTSAPAPRSPAQTRNTAWTPSIGRSTICSERRCRSCARCGGGSGETAQAARRPPRR